MKMCVVVFHSIKNQQEISASFLCFQCIQLLASEMESVDLSQLDDKAVRSIRQLQVCLHTEITFFLKYYAT